MRFEVALKVDGSKLITLLLINKMCWVKVNYDIQRVNVRKVCVFIGLE